MWPPLVRCVLFLYFFVFSPQFGVRFKRKEGGKKGVGRETIFSRYVHCLTNASSRLSPFTSTQTGRTRKWCDALGMRASRDGVDDDRQATQRRG